MNIPQLLPDPCPFCEGTEIHTNELQSDMVYATCDKCGACGPYDISDRLAIKKWNRRAPTHPALKDAAEGMKCVGCHGDRVKKSWTGMDWEYYVCPLCKGHGFTQPPPNNGGIG